MPYTVKESRTYEKTQENAYEAAKKAIAGLEGKVLTEDATAGTIQGQFDKKIHGKVLGDRSQILIGVTSENSATKVDVEAYPINPVGQKLMFGARKGVVPTVVSWFWAHLEHNLG